MPQENGVETVASAVVELIDGGFPLLQSTDVKQKLLQWNLDGSLKIERFRVLRKLSKETDVALIHDFFQDPTVQRRLKFPTLIAEGSKASLAIDPLRVTVSSLAFFDKLIDAKLVSDTGALRRCLDDVFDGATASDLLKESLTNPDSDHADVFSEDEQQEFIFHLFRALVIGGSMCQSDEWLASYTDMTKQFYKALVCVKKNAADRSAIDVTSRVYRVHGDGVFDSRSRFSSCFVVLDAKKRWLTVWHNAFRPFW